MHMEKNAYHIVTRHGGGLLGSLKRKFGLGDKPVSRKGLGWPAVAVFCVLGVLVIATFFLYVSRLSGAPSGGGYGTQDDTFTAAKDELTAPENVTVTVDKGATISWGGTDDVRLIGYNVYRYKAGDDPGNKVNAAIISDTVYHDDEGTMFNSYAVAPVDTNGREGIVSIPVVAVAEPVSLSGLTPTQKPEKVEDITYRDPPEQDLPASLVGSTSPGMSYYGVWYKEHYAEVTGGVIMVTPYYGDSASYTFSGDGIAVIATRHWNYGIMDIYIDGELRQQVDLYSPEIKVRDTVFSASGLGPGAHTIKVVCTGRKSQEANFTFINVEALQVR
jgi:hypothetical protein